MGIRLAVAIVALTLGSSVVSAAQTPADQERARLQSRLGWDSLKEEGWAEAARFFQRAIDIDPEFENAYYGLGRANMAQKKYPDAVAAYAKCRDLYRAYAGRQFGNAQDAQRHRSNRITEIDEMMRQVQTGPQNAQTGEQLRQLQETRRQLQDAIQRGSSNMVIESTVPVWVSLALGSAYFRAGRILDAEREYKAAVAGDSKIGEAHNNLAVVYLQTGRIDDAEKAVKAAEKTGFRVNPMLKDDIAAKRK